MLTLLVLGVIALVIWAASGNNKQAEERRQRDTLLKLQQSHQGWIDFVAGYAAVAKTKPEKALVARMLADIKAQQGGIPSGAGSLAAQEANASQNISFGGYITTDNSPAPTLFAEIKPKHEPVQVDNASLLLYFGAFLFVASAGLFVSFSGAPGSLKVLTVVLVMISIYSSGLWLYRNRPKLRQAGQAFAGIGLVLAPLVGVSLYAYVFDQHHGVAVWMLTSLLCLGLYAHALAAFRTSLMGYIFIFTFLSLFESGVGITGVPVYCYGWGLAAFGILLQLLQRQKGWWPELDEPSKNGAQLLLPVAVFVSLAVVPQLGAMQLGVSLLLAAAFYGLEISRRTGSDQQACAVLSQSAAITGFAALGYGQIHYASAVAVVLIAVNGLQLVALAAYGSVGNFAKDRLWYNFGSVLLVASVASILVAVNEPKLLLVSAAATVVVGAVIWWRQRRPEAYMLASLAWMGLPFIYGQAILGSITPEAQTIAGFVSLLVLLLAYLTQYQHAHKIKSWTDFAGVSYEAGAIAVLVASAFAGPYFCLAAALVVAGLSVILAESDKRNDWAELAALALFFPMVRSWDEPDAFLIITLVVLATLIGLSLRYRRELLRWASTFVWLLLPYALGEAEVIAHWQPAVYAWAYVAAMAGLMLSRAIARGTFFLSSKVPLSTMMRSASLSYVVGYVAAAILALGLSLVSDNSQVHTSLILLVFGVAIVGLSRVIERRDDILALLPLLIQALALSAIRPEHAGSSLQVFLILSTILAVASFLITEKLAVDHPELRFAVQTSLMASFVAPAAIIFVPTSWPMPIGLLVAGSLLVYYARTLSLSSRELAGGLIALAIMWFLQWAGVHELQAYTHILVGLFGLYAFGRSVRGQTEETDGYLWCMLLTATVPLAFEALNSTNGGLYGWWLLLEQVAIMLLGMAIKRRFVTMWGLYVAVGAVLYQLRGLGYAALAILALFLIGLAVYRLQKSDKNSGN